MQRRIETLHLVIQYHQCLIQLPLGLLNVPGLKGSAHLNQAIEELDRYVLEPREHLARLFEGHRQQLPVQIVDRKPGNIVEPLRPYRIVLVDIDVDHSLLPRENHVLRIARQNSHDLDPTGRQLIERLLAAAGHAVDRHKTLVAQQLLVDKGHPLDVQGKLGLGRHDDDRRGRALLSGEPDPKDQQDQKGSHDQGDDQAGLLDDIQDFFDQKGREPPKAFKDALRRQATPPRRIESIRRIIKTRFARWIAIH